MTEPNFPWVNAPAQVSDSYEPWSRVLSSAVLIMGIIVLWGLTPILMFVNVYGDCFGTTEECHRAWVMANEQAAGMLAISGFLTVAVALAVITYWRTTLMVVLASGVALLGLMAMDLFGPFRLPYLPVGVIFLLPTAACLFAGSHSRLLGPVRQ